jgi:hypothetical protein
MLPDGCIFGKTAQNRPENIYFLVGKKFVAEKRPILSNTVGEGKLFRCNL